MLGKRIALIGAGQMGAALLHGFLERGVVSRDEVVLSDPNRARIKELSARYGVSSAQDNAQAARDAGVVLLAVKPQQIDDVLAGLSAVISPDKLVISIAAGVTSSRIARGLTHAPRIVRVMPNTPALVGKAVSVVSAGSGAGAADVEVALRLFSAVGDVIELPEDLLDAVTAVSGSGPAYFYLLTEALMEAGVAVGLDEKVADRLAKQTLIGAAMMIEQSERQPAELRAMVTSPGGTTMAAIQVFDRFNFREIVREAVAAAVRRAGELAGG